jgi:calcium/calmodulin-dependent protein kinase I
MEYMKLGDLYQSIAHMPPLPEIESALISSQILEGLEFMHENNFAHRDMKPQVHLS